MKKNNQLPSILQKNGLKADHPDFFLHIFSEVFPPLNSAKNEVEKIFIEDAKLSVELKRNPLQENSSLRNIIRTRRIAYLLIDDNSLSINDQKLNECIEFIENNTSILGPFNDADYPFIRHTLNALNILKNNNEVRKIIKSFGKPLKNTLGDYLIKETMGLIDGAKITDSDAKRAMVTALISYFRQNVGSCFATAPALIIQQEQPERFLLDLKDLLELAMLKRTFAGSVFAVPISPTFGSASLKRPFLWTQRINSVTESIGFLKALEKALIIDPSLDYELQKNEAQKVLEKTFFNFRPIVITLETIIKKILLTHLQLTEDDLEHFKEMPSDIAIEKIAYDAGAKESKKTSKAELIKLFNERFKRAVNYFVSMTENPLLKTWEFTLASFAESKPNFLSWNLYSSLGLKSDEAGGIGPVIIQFLNNKLEEFKRIVEELNSNYEAVFLEVKALESQSRLIDSESKANYIKMQYTSKRLEMDALLDKRELIIDKANKMSGLFVRLVDLFIEKFPDYFQEIYDANMQISLEENLDDSPAGFRLLFKHGRSNPLLWQLIYTPDEFIDCLVRFFVLIENDITQLEDIKPFQNEISSLFDEIIRHLRSKEFIVSAFDRVAIVGGIKPIKEPLDNLDKISKKPWVYTSGGSMASLVSCLYGRQDLPYESSRWVESEMELLVFFSDVLKEMPSKFTDGFLKNPSKSMLAFSPTHAYVFKPGLKPFFESWTNPQYTYTWIRDNFISAQRNFLHNIYLNKAMIGKLLNDLFIDLPIDMHTSIDEIKAIIPHDIAVNELRDELIKASYKVFEKKSIYRSICNAEQIDSLLYESIPYISNDQLLISISSLLDEILGQKIQLPIELQKYLESSSLNYSYISSKDLFSITSACLIMLKDKIFFKDDIQGRIIEAMKNQGLSMPMPMLVGDANWFNSYLGFTINPSTIELELWCFDFRGKTGQPIKAWKKWLNGTDKKKWGLFNKPFEYGQE
jgi:hypothetical protein